MIAIYTASTTTEADIVKSLLEDHGIKCVVGGYHHRSQLGFMGPYIECRVMVTEEDAEEARRHLDEMSEKPEQEQSQEPPVRHAEKASSRRKPLAAFGMAYIFPGLGSLYLGRRELGGWLIMASVICFAVILFEITFNLGVYIVYAAGGMLAVMVCDVISVVTYWRRACAETAQTSTLDETRPVRSM